MTVIVDTDVTSYFLKEDSRAELYRPHLLGLPNYFIYDFGGTAPLGNPK